MKKNYQTNTILIFLITILTLYIINSSIITNGIISYTKLFISKLFPSTFLIYTFSSLLINYQLIEKLTIISKNNASSLYIIIMSLISGFPSGSKYVKGLYQSNYISKKTANTLLTFTHFPNPLFILGPVNSLIKNNSLTYKLLLSIYISNFIIGLLFYKKNETINKPTNKQYSFSKILNISIIDSIKTIILIYGTSLFFYLISLLITNYIKLSPIPFIIINGFFDLTKGIFSTSIISSSILKTYIILIFLIFGSISIHIQIKSILSDTSLNYKYFLLGRIISTILSLIILTILITF